jgi:hypothetical protein
VKKATVVILNQFNIKKIKSTKIILEKTIKKTYKNHVGNTVAIQKNYKTKLLISSILKK